MYGARHCNDIIIVCIVLPVPETVGRSSAYGASIRLNTRIIIRNQVVHVLYYTCRVRHPVNKWTLRCQWIASFPVRYNIIVSMATTLRPMSSVTIWYLRLSITVVIMLSTYRGLTVDVTHIRPTARRRKLGGGSLEGKTPPTISCSPSRCSNFKCR